MPRSLKDMARWRAVAFISALTSEWFGSIFLLAQFLQIVQGYSPLAAGVRTLPWTAMPMLVAPLGGILTQRLGGRPVLATGLALQAIGLAWMAP